MTLSRAVVLAWDTTGDRASIALQCDGALVEECPLVSPNGFGHILYLEVESLLTRHGLAWRDVDVFAAASGPGAFTGVRVGLTAAKGLAEATGKRAAGVSNLAALAEFGTADLRAPVIDARRGEVYAAVYDRWGQMVRPEVVATFDDWVKGLPEGAEIVREGPLLSGVIARLAKGVDPIAVDANYVRRSDAELKWEERG